MIEFFLLGLKRFSDKRNPKNVALLPATHIPYRMFNLNLLPPSAGNNLEHTHVSDTDNSV